MTQVVFDVVDLVGEVHPGDQVSVWPPHVTATVDGRVQSTRKIDVLVDEGPVTEDIDPGPLVVQLRCRGITDTKPRTVTVPDEGTITLANLLQSTFTYTPAVVSQVALDAQRAEDAADSAETVADAFGSLEGVQAAVDGAASSAAAAAGSATAAAGFATDAGDAAVRAETAAENAEMGIAPDSVLRTMLEPAIRLELDGLRADVDGVSSSWSDITDKPAAFPPEGHDHPAVEISDSSVVGRSVLTAVDAAAARAAIGAGTSSLVIGTTSSTAKAGNYQPTAANITDATTVGRNVLKAADAAAARTAIGAGTSNLALGSTSSTAASGNHTHSQYAESSRVTALEGSQPIIVSSMDPNPLPGRIYYVTG